MLEEIDRWNVTLDALAALKRSIETATPGVTPWEDYDAEDDPKATRAGYLAALEEAAQHCEGILNEL